MRLLLSLLVLIAPMAQAQTISYWASGLVNKGNAQLAQQYFFLAGPGISITYTNPYVYINNTGGGGGGGGGTNTAFATNSTWAFYATNWFGSNLLYMLLKNGTNAWSTNAIGAVYATNGPNGQPLLTGNQTITLSGDATGSGATAIAVTVTNIKANGVVGTAAQVLTATGAGVGWSNLPAASAAYYPAIATNAVSLIKTNTVAVNAGSVVTNLDFQGRGGVVVTGTNIAGQVELWIDGSGVSTPNVVFNNAGTVNYAGAGSASGVANHSLAVGYNSAAANSYSVALGESANASASYGVAVGYQANGGSSGVGIGYQSAGQNGAVAVGYLSVAYDGAFNNFYGTAIGNRASAPGNGNVAIGGDGDNTGNPAAVPAYMRDTVELGRGTATDSGYLHFRGHKIADGSGVIVSPIAGSLTNNAATATTATNWLGSNVVQNYSIGVSNRFNGGTNLLMQYSVNSSNYLYTNSWIYKSPNLNYTNRAGGSVGVWGDDTVVPMFVSGHSDGPGTLGQLEGRDMGVTAWYMTDLLYGGVPAGGMFLFGDSGYSSILAEFDCKDRALFPGDERRTIFQMGTDVYGNSGLGMVIFPDLQQGSDNTTALGFFSNGGISCGDYNTVPPSGGLYTGGAVSFDAGQFYSDGNGNVTATSFLPISDQNLKTNLVPLTGAIDRLNKVPVYTWKWKPIVKQTNTHSPKGNTNQVHTISKTNIDNQVHIGPMAQDWSKIFGGKTNGINMQDEIGVLLAAVKELDARVKVLEAAKTNR